ncbi:Cobalamin-independent synthase, Catalytic domain [Nocardioides alpinus]|uniref:Cobalamin-independent synthase, Catalytic domain n=1 Tax=Nocardioides alpinus TaxID=748909 RepID=A0A1I0XGA4_9ACTN|nr:methionine synthase [Nocardioides alpinus]SFB00109.1 Cobalamin-independent synthase, Catalytic domain [Nocardioides alpinus]
MSTATGIGSLPGEDYAEAVRLVLGELSDLPYVPEVPARGVTAGMTGRGLAVVAGLAADLQPAGWRLTDASGVDHRRARSLLAQDLDVVEELGQDYTGAFKTQVTGPWTLAATVEKPRGDKVLSDHGARRELAQALAEGLTVHLADLRRRLRGVDRWIVQVDEPALAAVVNARVPTASGFGRHRRVDPPEASAHLEWVVSAITAAGAEAWVHSCAPQTPWSLVAGTGVSGLSADLDQLSPGDLDTLAEALEAGHTAALGVVPSTDPAAEPSDARLTERVQRLLDMLGLDPEVVREQLVITPTCGLAGASPSWAARATRLSATVARNL